jgi:hypothetical protein
VQRRLGFSKIVFATLDPACASARQKRRGPVAQRLEQGAHNALVGGSSPSGPTNHRHLAKKNNTLAFSGGPVGFRGAPLRNSGRNRGCDYDRKAPTSISQWGRYCRCRERSRQRITALPARFAKPTRSRQTLDFTGRKIEAPVRTKGPNLYVNVYFFLERICADAYIYGIAKDTS